MDGWMVWEKEKKLNIIEKDVVWRTFVRLHETCITFYIDEILLREREKEGGLSDWCFALMTLTGPWFFLSSFHSIRNESWGKKITCMENVEGPVFKSTERERERETQSEKRKFLEKWDEKKYFWNKWNENKTK